MGNATADDRPPLTVLEASRRLNVSRSAVYELVASGRLPAARLSPRRIRIPAAAVDQLLREITKGAAQWPGSRWG